MHLDLTLLTPGRTPLDVAVDAEPGTALGDIADELAGLAGLVGASTEFYAGTRLLAARTPLGGPDLRSGCVLGVGAPGPRDRGVSGILELRVVSGPDAGAVHPLPRGRVVVGRDDGSDVPVADPDVSRRHVEIAVSGDGVTVHDLGSTNGTTLDELPVGADPVSLTTGSLLRIGETGLTLAVPTDPPAAVRAGEDGTLTVHRPPRLCPSTPQVEVVLPQEPVRRSPGKVPVFAAIVPLLAGVGLAFALRSAAYLAFAALSPVMVLGSAVSDRWGLRRSSRRERGEYRAALARADTELARAVAEDTRLRRAEAPDLAVVRRTACGPGARLWERRRGDPDHLVLRLGTATRPARITVRRSGAGPPPADPPTARSVPVTVGLRSCGVLGIAGPAAPVDALLRALVGQVATLHGPQDLQVVLLADDASAGRWSWLRWVPHLSGPDGGRRIGVTGDQRRRRVGELLSLLGARSRDRQTRVAGWTEPSIVILIDRASLLRDDPGVARLLDEGPALGIYAICADRAARLLPAECGALVEVIGEVGTRLRLVAGDDPPIEQIVVDGAGLAWANDVCRALAPLRLGGGDARDGPPPASRLLDLFGVDVPTAEAIRAHRRPDLPTTRVVLGESAQGAYAVDLVADGPHALVAGTTGSGKSELLQTVVLGLAITNGPDQMTFVLIDYKGGAAFKDCADLPHTVGLVTDLDHHLTRRALRSLDAEVARRERLLSSEGAKDIDDYLRARAGSAEPLPRLVIVVDEFATLVDELPDFVTGLVGIAMRGRSLGVHLILATQRPSGVVSPVIRANTSLRLALRMTDDSESRDVLDLADAARISASRPGRGFARTATGAPVEFQAARVGGRHGGSPTRPDRPTVCLSPWSTAGDIDGTPADPIDDADTDLRTTVAAIRSAVDPHTDPPRRPWLPPLPTVVTLADLGDRTGDVLPFALADHPAEQRQGTHAIDLARGGSVLVAGGPRSGRSTTLRTIAGAAASRFTPEDLHLYVLDCAGGALSAAKDLPHCGAVCGRRDVDRGDRMLTRLAGEVDRRQALLGARGFASVTEQRAAVPEADRLAWLLLLIDGWAGFQAAYDEVDGGRPVETLLRLAREGAAAGLRVVVTGDRAALTGRISAALPTKIMLSCADSLDYGLAGLPARAIPDAMPDGRIIVVDGAVEAQVALLGPDPSGRAQAAALGDIARRAANGVPTTRPRAFRVRSLPASVDPADIVVPAAPGPLWALVGVGGDDADAVGVDLARDGPGFLIAGPARSGRSTALRTMARSLLAQGTPIAVVAARRSPLRALAGTPGVRGVFGPGDAGPLGEALEAGPVVAVVDDIALLTDTAAGDVVTDVLKSDDGVRAVIAAGRNDEVAMLFRGPAVTVRADRCGLLLSPGPTDGDLLGVRLPRGVGPAPPGRGVLVVGGRVSAVQVAAGGVLRQ